MNLMQIALPAIQDVGIIDVEKWGNSFDYLYDYLMDTIFDKKRNLQPHLRTILRELQFNSSAGNEPQSLAVAFTRVCAIHMFTFICMDRHNERPLDT